MFIKYFLFVPSVNKVFVKLFYNVFLLTLIIVLLPESLELSKDEAFGKAWRMSRMGGDVQV